VLDTLTKGLHPHPFCAPVNHQSHDLLVISSCCLAVLVALYEENDKPSSAVE